MSWSLVYTSQAKRDAKKLSRSGLKPQTETILEILRNNPCQSSPPFERLVGGLAGASSRRLNIQRRIVYQVLDDTRTVKIIRMWTPYE